MPILLVVLAILAVGTSLSFFLAAIYYRLYQEPHIEISPVNEWFQTLEFQENIARRLRNSIFSVFTRPTVILPPLLTIFIILSLILIIFGLLSNIFLLTITSIANFIFSGILFIFLYTFMVKTTVSLPSPTVVDASAAVRIQGREAARRILRKEYAVQYEYLSDGQTMYDRRRFRLQALQDGVDCYPDTYLWTGVGKRVIRSLTLGFEIGNHRQEIFRPEWNSYDVRFPHSLSRGEEIEFTIEKELFDEGRTAKPYLSIVVGIPTEYLLLEVILPPNLAPKKAYTYEFENYMDDMPISVQKVPWDSETYTIRYEIPKPQLHHRYLIRWIKEKS